MIGLSTSIGKKIEAPISAFNNLLIQISDRLEDIYISKNTNELCLGKKRTKNALFINQLLFEEKCITIFGSIKILLVNNEICFKFHGTYDSKKIHLVRKTFENVNELKQIFQHYLFIISSISNNLDDSVSQKYVDSIFEQINLGTVDPNKMFLIPHKNKIKHLYDESNPVLDKLYNRYSYIVKFRRNDRTFNAKLIRALSSELNESKSMDNVRFEDVEQIKEVTLPINDLQKFLIDLFYYGNFNF